MNSIGTLYDARLRDAAFRSGAEVKTRIGKDRFTVEMRVPAEALGTPIADGSLWQLLAVRNCRSLQPPKTREWSSFGGAAPHAAESFSRLPLGTNVVKNGSFNELFDVPVSRRTAIKSAKFPKSWGAVDAAMAMENGKNILRINNVVWTLLAIPDNDRVSMVRGTVTASGSGRLVMSFSSCVRKPGERRAFQHEKRRQVLDVRLTDKAVSYPFSFPLGAYEKGYIYLNASDCRVERISAALTSEQP